MRALFLLVGGWIGLSWLGSAPATIEDPVATGGLFDEVTRLRTLPEPTDDDLRLLAYYAKEAGEYAVAERAAEQLLSRSPHDDWAEEVAAHVRWLDGDYAGAHRALTKRVARLEALDPPPASLVDATRRDLQQLDELLRDLEPAREHRARLDVWFHLSWIVVALGSLFTAGLLLRR